MLCSLAEEISLTWNKNVAGSSKMCVYVSARLYFITVTFEVTAMRKADLTEV